ncbi:putative anti-sigma regulatory factor, serine/threonine protein kinase [Desulfatibacillum aliphaticivorans]|uniref:Anti-sigma regulatory factor, serine/threonine protein kinase n=1 Tax=Desulfatibacillum aliphaticivorans TaxID=218208 RepID=B8FMM1_DESAL|nr:serine/threonine protein kinase [Desulfatibacillum aliphaticivorans]ACL01888.1 putative anti-sigma regulatory factor, serine/threonine protein kinase [Desulfatibacillum aliphaticivorans]
MNASEVVLELAASPEFFPVARSVTENASLAMGLEKAEARRVAMATEEIFMSLCKSAPGRKLSIRCTPGGYCVITEFIFQDPGFPLEYFNMTSSVSTSNEQDMANLGLLVASRIMDGFSVERDDSGRFMLKLIKEKCYPRHTGEGASYLPPLAAFSVRKANSEEAAYAAAQAVGLYPSHALPRHFLHPRMLADRIDFGGATAAIAVGPGGEIAGIIAWDLSSSGNMVECHGPFLFTRDGNPALCEALLDFCIGDIAKLPVMGLINRRHNRDIPIHYFETVGSLPLTAGNGETFQAPAYFRQMQEDTGCNAWAHESLEEFLEKQYARLCLPRKILRPSGRALDPQSRSVLFSEFDRNAGNVTFLPVSPGQDILPNVEAHLKMANKESIKNVFFGIDLGRPWQADFAPAILQAGFSPRYILPYAGCGDMAFFSL